MAETQKLREQRANTWEQMKALLSAAETAGRDFTAEEKQTYDRMESELDSLGDRIERIEKAAGRDEAFNRVDRRGVVPADDLGGVVEDAEYDRICDSFLRNGVNDMDPEDRAFMRAKFSTIENAAGVGSGAAGGYTVPPGFRDKFVETLKYYGPMLRVAEVIQTDSGANFQWPTNDDTANVGALLAENTQVTEQDVTFGTASLDSYMYTSKLVRVALQLLQDNAIDMNTWLPRKLGERVGRILNQHFTTGTGTGQPDGIVTSATVGVTGTGSLATTGGISYDNIVDLIEALDPAYGGQDGLQFMFHQSVRKALRKLKDSQGRPLWEPSLQAGVADQFAGYSYVINNDMATLATNSKSLLFGAIDQAYVIRLVTGLQTMRLTERYADFLQVGFLAFQRADGTLQDANAVRTFQTTATA